MVRFLGDKQGIAAADKLKSELMKVVKTGESCFNPPEFKNKKGKTAEQQLDAYKAKCAQEFRNASKKFIDLYYNVREKDHEERKNDLDKRLVTPELMKLIDAILDYQKGKEKVMSGAAGHRFDNSMILLASVTAGIPMEKYLDQQIANVNKVRGAQPGSRDFITKEGLFEGFKADKNGLQNAQHVNEQNAPVRRPLG